ncbi:adenine phosphoribosyltransferase [Marihabitans asiaticum]|uniref:Adenine phosphoribosyltransferase n=1 Tax=Marihabitans asiaticum TaxID=415218 RepID=A0A560W6P8_9MICO|nr:adenine phosphoribosyltransferase [Marihabitans asiaticum]TWD13287.1 adenine phosphoribosyltransferase [Marihabitans asiaticum]
MSAPDAVSLRATAGRRVSELVRDVPDFPKAGVTYKDITPLIAHGDSLRLVVDALAAPYQDRGVDHVIGLEARGFIFGTGVALALGAGFVPIRKKGKLPPRTVSLDYELEYGSATIELREDSLRPGDRVLVIDDILATGGTARAAAELVESQGAQIVGLDVVLELRDLGGRGELPGRSVGALVSV